MPDEQTSPNKRNPSNKLVALTKSRGWQIASMILYSGIALVMARGWIADPKDAFFLLMGAFSAGSAVEYAVKLAYPRGNQLGAALLPIALGVMACAFLFGRDGYWLYGVFTLLGCIGIVVAAFVTAAKSKAAGAKD